MKRYFVFALCTFAPAAAWANAPAPFSRPVGATPGVVVERASPLTVERETLDIDCKGKEHPDCTFRATYFLFNPAPQEEEVLGSFYGFSHIEVNSARKSEYVGPVHASLDGQKADVEATEEQYARMESLVLQDPEAAAMRNRGFALDANAFRVKVASGARAQLVFEGTLRATRFEHDDAEGGYAYPGLMARHPLVTARHPFLRTADEFLYLVTPISHWAGDPEVAITIRRDAGTGFSASSPGGWTTSSAGDVVIEKTTVRASAKKNLRFRMTNGSFPLVNGGPLVAIGPRFGREELRVRAGYEFGGPSWMIYGINAETNFTDYVTPAVMAEVATPGAILVFPSLGLGAGVPVQFRKGFDPRVGIRSQVTLSFPFVSFVFPIDVYPAGSSSGSHVEGSFLTQLSF